MVILFSMNQPPPHLRATMLALSLSCFIAGASSSSAQTIGNSDGGWAILGTDPIEITYAGKLVTKYNAGGDAGKPYFYPLIGPTGENMTRHWPMEDGHEEEQKDHIHHRGLWYGLGNVNGLDFWHFPLDESKKDHTFGSIRHEGMDGVEMSNDALTFKVKSAWLAYDDPAKRVMSDQRKFHLFYREDGALVIDITLSLIADAGDVLIKDDKEGAWSIRTLPTLRLEGPVAKGSSLNSEGITGKEVWGKRATWVDFSGPDREGRPVGIAILDHPKNLRSPTWWHARHYGLVTANPFGQGNFEKEAGAVAGVGDYMIKNGETLIFQYRTIFHHGDAAAAKIAEAAEAFGKE